MMEWIAAGIISLVTLLYSRRNIQAEYNTDQPQEPGGKKRFITEDDRAWRDIFGIIIAVVAAIVWREPLATFLSDVATDLTSAQLVILAAIGILAAQKVTKRIG